jgi:putative ABC transport system permease protein
MGSGGGFFLLDLEMFQNYLKIALRNLVRRKGYALLNILGLAIGMACCLVIFEYVAYERSFDRFEPHADRLYRVQDEDYQGGRMVLPCAAAMPGVAGGMMREFPEVENACRLYRGNVILSDDSRYVKIRESTIYYADQAVLPMFGIKMLYGDARSALTGPGKLLLSAMEARRLYGDQNPVGRVLSIHTGARPEPITVEVTGVYQDGPLNSHLKLPVLVSYPTLSVLYGIYGKPDDLFETSYSWTDFYTYVLLRPGVSAARLSAKLPAFIDEHYNNLPRTKSSGDSLTLSLMPVEDIHLRSHYTEEAEPSGDDQSVSFLFLVAFLIIGIAWINYINLATARSLERAKEVGVRKVLGALRGELIRQFMMESLLMNSAALLVAVGLTLGGQPLLCAAGGPADVIALHHAQNLLGDISRAIHCRHPFVGYLSGACSFPLPGSGCAEGSLFKFRQRPMAATRVDRRSVRGVDHPDRRDDRSVPAGALYA